MKKSIASLCLSIPIVALATKYYGISIKNGSTQNLYLYTIARSSCLKPNRKVSGVESSDLPVRIGSTAVIRASSTVQGNCPVMSITFGISPGSPIGLHKYPALIKFTSIQESTNPKLWRNQITIESNNATDFIKLDEISCISNWRPNNHYQCSKEYPFITQDNDKIISAFIKLKAYFPPQAPLSIDLSN